ncbi:MAG: response regulator [Pseudomonadota bacterium]|nr:response regulator [Pseudomonadota bacterium]
MLKILIVEDDRHLATTLKYLVEDNPRYRVVAVAEDVGGAVAAAAEHDPDIALVDLHLARGTNGFSVAVRLGDLDVPCLFVTGQAPAFPMPDLALGCLLKPFTAEEAHRAIGLAEDKMRGRDALRQKLPANLTIYDDDVTAVLPQPGFIPSRPSLITRLEHWIQGHSA